MDLNKSLQGLTSRDIDPAFWTPSLIGKESAWWAHVPFAFWIMLACRPRLFVELGTYNGVSYAAFCDANRRGRIGARCRAVDTWLGDEHSGRYGEAVFSDFKSFHDANYRDFSELMRCTFDEAQPLFDDCSIDLLHIDGLHTYAAVKHDLEHWRRKLSDRAVVLMHDTNVYERDFGVHQLFRELAVQHPSFQFMHGHGLGIVALGRGAPAIVQQLAALDHGAAATLRDHFAYLGERWHATAREQSAHARSEWLAGQLEAAAGVPKHRSASQPKRPQLVSQRGGASTASVPWRIKRSALRLLGRWGRKRATRMTFADAIHRSAYFDPTWYLAQTPSAAGDDPAMHYLRFGGPQGRDPGPRFSVSQYLRRYPDVARFGNPFLHYVLYGESEGLTVQPSRAGQQPRVLSGPRQDTHRFSILCVSGNPDSPGHAYRVTNFVAAATANGSNATWVASRDLPGYLDEVAEYDVLMIWRAELEPALETAIAIMRARGGKVVFDIDDLCFDPDLAKTSIIDGIRTQNYAEADVRSNFAHMRQTLLAADICVAPTQELAYHMRRAGKVAYVLPNGFDRTRHVTSRAARAHARGAADGLIRIGYAGGTPTHQRDFAVVAQALARVLAENDHCRLVLFRNADEPQVDIDEFACFALLHDRIEWRDMCPLSDLPDELARFEVNLAPVEIGNPFCEAKSELKFFEAAIADVPTVASPTGPFRRAIEHGKTGFLAASGQDWYVYLDALVRDPALRARIGRNAYYAALASYGPERRALQLGLFIEQLHGGERAARAFALHAQLSRPIASPTLLSADVVFAQSKGGVAAVTVIIPLYNYESFVVEALDSVERQTLAALDLIVVDDHSTDGSLQIATLWAKQHADRFNRIAVLKNRANYGLGFCRNAGFDAAETPYVLPLDADNRLRPSCCATLLTAIVSSHVAYVYPTIQHFGGSDAQTCCVDYDAQRFVGANFVDAMALVSKEAWAMIGGYQHVPFGWEDYDFWARMAEIGLAGKWCNDVLAEYRFHANSMLRSKTMVAGNLPKLLSEFEQRHPWVSLVEREALRQSPLASPALAAEQERTRLDTLLPLLRCPVTGQKLGYDAGRRALVSYDGRCRWPIVEGRPVLAPGLSAPEIRPHDHLSNELSDAALALIREHQGLVLNLSAGGSREKFDHVVELDYAIFRHTDVVGDAHALPFDDASFDAVVAMNAFEHYRNPPKVVAEVLRVLKPGGRMHAHSAFLQPLHERPWHFYACTRHGLEEWFKQFETERLQVSGNFCPNHTIAWIAYELQTALRSDVSAEAADRFRVTTLGEMADLWADPAKRNTLAWTDLFRLSQPNQEVTAAGFEFIGRKPERDIRASP